MAGCATHAPLEMGASLPFLPAKAHVTVTTRAQFRFAIDGHGFFGVPVHQPSVASLAGHAVLLPGTGGRIVACHVADEAGAGFALFGPIFDEGGIGGCLGVGSVLPVGSELRVT